MVFMPHGCGVWRRVWQEWARKGMWTLYDMRIFLLTPLFLVTIGVTATAQAEQPLFATGALVSMESPHPQAERENFPVIKGLYLGMSMKEVDHVTQYKLEMDLKLEEEGVYYFVQRGSDGLRATRSDLRTRSLPSDLIIKTDTHKKVTGIILSGACVKRWFHLGEDPPIEPFVQQFAIDHHLKPPHGQEPGRGTVWYEMDNPKGFNLKIENSFRILLASASGES